MRSTLLFTFLVTALAPGDLVASTTAAPAGLENGLTLAGWSCASATASSGAPPTADATWFECDPRFVGGTPDWWSGSGWFRTELTIGPELVGRTLALRSYQLGAADLHLDGALLVRWGSQEPGEEAQLVRRPPPFVLTFDRPGTHELLVRYANPEVEAYERVGKRTGFSLTLSTADRALAEWTAEERFNGRGLGFFPAVFAAFALLHLLLWVFRRDAPENLDYALLCLSLTVIAVFLFLNNLTQDPRVLLYSEPTMNVAGLLFGVFALRFLYRLFYHRAPPWGVAYYGAATLWLPYAVWRPRAALSGVFLLMLAASVEMIRTAAVAVVRGKPGARLVGAGISCLAIGFGIGLLANLGVLPASRLLGTIIPFVSVLALLLCSSLHLARSVGATHRELQQRLVEVERLSEEKLAQERRNQELLVERRLLEAEVERKLAELEEARRLQLSMLPASLPDHPELEIAAFMQTAEEVGGDYYDFATAPDGAMVVAVGDATGHGLRAGTMVTATKSLFGALGADPDLLAVLGTSTRALKRMNLRRLAMALALARFEGPELRFAAAGMPPALLHRAATGEIEHLAIGGMPLGSMLRCSYQQATIELLPGDTVLLMSDGFPERLRADGEMLGYERATRSFADLVGETPPRLVEQLAGVAESWADGEPPADDTTFVVVRYRGRAA